MNDLIQVPNRTVLMATINHMTKKGLPFKLNAYSISYYRLPSSGLHPAVHFFVEEIYQLHFRLPRAIKTYP